MATRLQQFTAASSAVVIIILGANTASSGGAQVTRSNSNHGQTSHTK